MVSGRRPGVRQMQTSLHQSHAASSAGAGCRSHPGRIAGHNTPAPDAIDALAENFSFALAHANQCRRSKHGKEFYFVGDEERKYFASVLGTALISNIPAAAPTCLELQDLRTQLRELDHEDKYEQVLEICALQYAHMKPLSEHEKEFVVSQRSQPNRRTTQYQAEKWESWRLQITRGTKTQSIYAALAPASLVRAARTPHRSARSPRSARTRRTAPAPRTARAPRAPTPRSARPATPGARSTPHATRGPRTPRRARLRSLSRA